MRLTFLIFFMLFLVGCSQAEAVPEVDIVSTAAEYYIDSVEWEAALALVSAGVEIPKEVYSDIVDISDQAISTYDLAGYISLLTAGGLDIYSFGGVNLADMLSERQQDGSFGFLEDTVRAAIALENAGVNYDVEGVLHLLVTAQKADGSFEGDDALTGLCLSLLSCYEDIIATTMRERATVYLTSKEVDQDALPYVVMGLIDVGGDYKAHYEALLATKRDNGSFPAPEAVVAIAAEQNERSILVERATSDAMVEIVVTVSGEVLVSGRLEAGASDDAIAITKRFLALQGYDFETVMDQVVRIGEHKIPFTLEEGSSALPFGTVTWVG